MTVDIPHLVRQHLAALRALLVLTVITGFGYPLLVWGLAQLPGLHAKAEGSIITVAGKPVGSRLIGQLFTDKDGKPLLRYFQSRPSAAGAGYDPTATGGSNLGPENIVDTPADPAKLTPGADPATAGYKPSLLTQVCSRSVAVGQLEGVDGSRPFCTGGGVGAVLSVIGPRDSSGNVTHPNRVVSVNEPCSKPEAQSAGLPAQVFRPFYEGVRVQCAQYGEDYSIGQVVPIRGAGPEHPAVPADAVTASASGLDPDISPQYAEIQATRIAHARGVTAAQVLDVVHRDQRGRQLGFVGEPVVNVLQLNLDLDRAFPVQP
jgi:potassium-transporting ATPase KdpC subunit